MTRPGAVTVVGNGVAGYACATQSGGPRRAGHADRPRAALRPAAALQARAPPRRRARTSPTRRELAAAGIGHLDGWATELDLDRRSLVVRDRRSAASSGRVEFERLVWATGPAHRPAAVARHRAGRPERRRGIDRGRAATARAGRPPGRRDRRRPDRMRDRRDARPAATASRSLERADAAARAPACAGARRGRAGARRARRARSRRLCDRRASTVPAQAASCAPPPTATWRPTSCWWPPESRPTLPPALGGGRTVDTDERLAVPGADGVWACGDVAAFPHPRFGRIADPALGQRPRRRAHTPPTPSWARPRPYVRDPYWFSDIGPLRIQQVGLAPAACEWSHRDGLHIGRGSDGSPACIVLLDSPQRLNDARRAAGGMTTSTTSQTRGPTMEMRLIIDPDTCVGYGECVAQDAEAVELDETGCARARTSPRSPPTAPSGSAPRAPWGPSRSSRQPEPVRTVETRSTLRGSTVAGRPRPRARCERAP